MAVAAELHDRYFRNRFIDLVRTQLRIDDAEWIELKRCLVDLGREWRGAQYIEKDIVQDLYVLPTVLGGVAERLSEQEPAKAMVLRQRATELDALILDAFAD